MKVKNEILGTGMLATGGSVFKPLQKKSRIQKLEISRTKQYIKISPNKLLWYREGETWKSLLLYEISISFSLALHYNSFLQSELLGYIHNYVIILEKRSCFN